MSKEPLGRLESVDLREYWQREDTDFTPWLARPDSLRVLGDVVGLTLELDGVEVQVGPFRADILCRNVVTGRHILIENQLEWTDHSHLGQIIMYAAGLDVDTVIWVASGFRDEHRAAIDWLNEVTGEDVHLFGIEVQLWRIDDSPPAPRFNVVARPNDWTKTVRGWTSGGFSERANMYRSLWSSLIDHLSTQHPVAPSSKPTGMHWLRIPLPDSVAVVSYAPSSRTLSFYVLFRGSNPVEWYRHVEADRVDLEKELQESFNWVDEGEEGGYMHRTWDFDHEAWPAAKQAEVWNIVGRLLTLLTGSLGRRIETFSPGSEIAP